MDKNRIMKYGIKTIVACLFIALQPMAAQSEAVGYTTYYFTDSGGNSVTTTSLNLAKKLLERTALLLDLELDNVYVPPVSAVTGATRPNRQSSEPFEKSRTQAILGIEQGLDATSTMAVNLYHSQEIDYVSNSVIGTYSKEMFQRNTTLSVRGQLILDQVGKILDNGDIEQNDKRSFWGVVRVSQLLSTTATLDVSYDGLYHNGFLSDPYRTVQVFDQNNAYVSVEEKHPTSRLRHAFAGRVTKMLPEVGASVMSNYRFYFDNWSVGSQTFEAQFSKYIQEEIIARFNYRFYAQTAADFFEERYRGANFLDASYRTADYKLQKFNSNNFGFSVTYFFKKVARRNQSLRFLENATVEGRYFRYFNSLNFSANIYQLNINFGI